MNRAKKYADYLMQEVPPMGDITGSAWYKMNHLILKDVKDIAISISWKNKKGIRLLDVEELRHQLKTLKL